MNPPDEAPLSSPDRPATTSPRPRMSRRGKWTGAVVAILVLVGLGGLTWYLTRPSTMFATPAIGGGAPGGPGGPGAGGGGGGRGASTVGVTTAERASIAVTLDALGTVTPLATVKVKPQVSGVLEKVLFKEGQMVRAGELLATIDARQFELALAQATGQRQRDAAQLESARVTLERFKTLLSQDSIARQEVDSQAALVKQLEGTVMVNNAAVGAAQLNLSYTKITAPVSGRVGLRTVDVGNTVSPSDANGVAVITQVMPMDVVFAVPQDRVSDVLNAAKSDMQVMALDRTRTGVLGSGTFASLDNLVDTTTGTVKAKARFANNDSALFANQFVNVQLRIKSIDNAVVVPVAAVRLGGSGDFVFVLNAAERTVSIRPVIRGQATGEKIVIVSGLKVGEQVITEGADRLKEGSRVTLSGDTPRGGGRRPGASAAAPNATPSSASSASTPPPAASTDKSAPAKGAAPAMAAPAVPAAPGIAPPAGPVAKAPPLPTPEQRLRMLEQVKDDPEGLARRKRFFELLDSGDPEALERWKGIVQRRQGGGQGGGERPAQ
ncbi:MAG: efflux RND transporter periplasmic adaptor subunit [Polaromonas sp.]